MPKLPEFADEKEEAEFWDSRDSVVYLTETEAVSVTFVNTRQPKNQISLRLDQEVIDRLKLIAAGRGIGYQAMIRMWVMERLVEETG